jgi:hypothetical protein
MKISDIINEDSEPLPPAIKGAMTYPNLNLNSGGAYHNYRFGIAMAGAPDFPTKADGTIAGDPLLASYTDAELDIINAAAKMVGAGKVRRLSSNRSQELSNTQVVSPVRKKKKNKYGV